MRRKTLQFILNIFPPLFFNRIILKNISKDYRTMKVVLKKSLININFHRTIFGGSIFSAFDPYLPTMYYHIFNMKNKKLEIWLKSANIKYVRPARSNLYLNFRVTEEDILIAEKNLIKNGKHEKWHTIQAKNKKGEICAEAEILIYLRDNKKELDSNF